MLNVFIWVLLLIYFWYFYYSDSEPVPPPNTPGPDPASPFDLTYLGVNEHTFEFQVNGSSVWHENIPSYFVTPQNIQTIDACFQSHDRKIPAEKLDLYRFVKENPKFQSVVHTGTNNGTIFRHGTPFYFTCRHNKIESLVLCASGHIFQKGDCQKVNSCTGQPNQTRFPHPDPHSWIECQDEEEHVRQCAPGEVFYGGKCTSKTESLCLLQKDLSFFKLDDTTLFGCRNHTPQYRTCPPGTQLFDSTVCEPNDCVGKPDGTRIPLGKRKRYPFEYTPGYWVCRQGKVVDTVECPSFWDPNLAKEENLTSFPMVFQRDTCAVPSLCENIWPVDKDIYVPRYEYTRDIQNWFHSKLYDQGKGYFCDDTGAKKEYYTPINMRINDHFKKVPACNENDPELLPLSDRLRDYLDCTNNSFTRCNAGQFFNGSQCVPLPEGTVFRYHNFIPIFELDSLNSEGWITPLTKMVGQDQLCEPGFEYVKMYQICSDPQCVPLAFLSMIPELSLLLKPGTRKAKCTYDETEKVLKRIALPDTLNYTFWDQKVRHEKDIQTETCQFGQNIQTGNFIWDSTVYATCDLSQPFVFCPSAHTRFIYPDSYACNPPNSFTYLHDQNINQHTEYKLNEFKRVLREDKNTSVEIQLNKSPQYNFWQEVPEDGFEIPDRERINIKATKPVLLEYKWRVTYPPHIAFEYVTDANGATHRQTHIADDPTKIFNLYTEQFEHGKFQFPRYRVKSFVEGLTIEHDPK